MSMRLTDPRVRLALGLAGLVLTGLSVKRDRVGRTEEEVFKAINHLPDSVYAPVWLVMQGGNLGAAPAVAAVAYATGRRSLACRLPIGGSATWVVAKLIKRGYRRPRPNALLTWTRSRGPEESGLGYVSGHAGMAVILGLKAYPNLSPPGRLAVLVAVPVIGLSRVYVGAHLPLCVVGGAALGVVIDAVTAIERPPSRNSYTMPGAKAT